MGVVGCDGGVGVEKEWIEVNADDKKRMVMMLKANPKPWTPGSGKPTKSVLETTGVPLRIHRAEYVVVVEKAMNLNLQRKPCPMKDFEVT